MATPRQHIEDIRKTKFSIGGELNPLTEDLHEAVKNLSAELYAKDVHFLMELIQNAEDNEYLEGVQPSLEFIVTSRDITGTGAPATLLVFNNEKGFSSKNVDSICSVGRSTKKGHRQRGYIGEKGIGFKSVFLITAQPYIFSNGYQIRFSEEPCHYCSVGYIVPEWVDEHPTTVDIQQIYGPANALPTTTIVLPLKPDKVGPVKQQLSSLHPEILLFLSKIKRLSVREDNADPRINTVSAISISSETDFIQRKNIDATSFTLHLSAEENGGDCEKECAYYMWRQKFTVKPENIVERRKGIEEWWITLAFPNGQRLNRGMSLPGVYAFLPTEMVTNFPFIIQADFVLASSRETILLDDKWNQGILDCVPSAFYNAFISLVRTTESVPVSTLIRFFEFLPVNASSYPKLNSVRESIKEKLVEENIVPCESYTEQKFFYKPSEVGRLMPAFWNILIKARKQGVSLHNLSSHGKYVLNSAFDKEEYNHILNFLGVRPMGNEWYARCIKSSSLVLGVSEDVYMELLLFFADNWSSCFQKSNIKSIQLIKYVDQEGNMSLWTINDATQWNGGRVYLSSDARHISWLIDWNREFRCATNWFFVPKGTQEALLLYPKKEIVKEWLSHHVEVRVVNVYDYASLLVNSLHNDRRLAIAFAHFLCHSLLKNYLSAGSIAQLCGSMPLVDNYGSVTTRQSGILVPANGSKWVGLIGSNPWGAENYIELGEDYLRAGLFAGVYTYAKQLMKFLETNIGASDIPDLCPPDAVIPTVSAPLTKDNTFLLLDWIRNLKRKGISLQGKFLRCIKEGNWLKINLGYSPGYRPPSQSFLLTSDWGNLLQNSAVLVDIPLIDQKFYDNRISEYKDELKTIGVMFEFGEACKFIGKHLMSLAASSNLTRGSVFSILNFIKFLREKYLPLDEFIGSIKEGRWLSTSHGYRSPVGSVLFDSEWKDASLISDLPFISQDYYGEDILNFKTELQLLGVVVYFNQNYQLVSDYFRLPTCLNSITADTVFLILECIQHSKSSRKLVTILKDRKWLRTHLGYKSPSECFLFDSKWSCLLQIFNDFPLIGQKFYGSSIFSYKDQLKEVGVMVDFGEAAIAFAHCFKQRVSSSLITKENVLSFLACYRQLKSMRRQFPTELSKCLREEKWLWTRLGYRSPKESILFGPDWESLSPIALLPFIDDTDKNYGKGIQEYKDELKVLGVVVEFKEGAKFLATGLSIPQNPSGISPTSVLSLLECIRNLLKEHNDTLPDEFLKRISKKWLKTHMGYRSPDKCLMFDSKWASLLQREDGPFIDEEFYGSNISSYRKELKAVGVTVDVANGCTLISSHLDSHTEFTVIARIYKYLSECHWEPENKSARWIWIPNGSCKGEWVNPEECVIQDKDNLFGSQLNVLENHYEKDSLNFFFKAFGVRYWPYINDYCKLWKEWENSRSQLLHTDCCAFWVYVAQNWTSKTEKLLADSLVKLPVETSSGGIILCDKQDVFIPDDLQLKDLFDKSSPVPIFVWYPQPSLPSMPRSKLLEIYSSIGVRSISESVQKNESSLPVGVELKQVNPIDILIGKGLVRLILGFLADSSLGMDAEKRRLTIEYLIDLTVLQADVPIAVSYSLSLSTGKSVDVETSGIVRWERGNSKLFAQKMDRLSGHKASIEFATRFSEVISQGLLWEKEDHIPRLSELIKLGFLLEFEEEAVKFLMRTKNLQLFMEDEEFLSSAFSSD